MFFKIICISQNTNKKQNQNVKTRKKPCPRVEKNQYKDRERPCSLVNMILN